MNIFIFVDAFHEECFEESTDGKLLSEGLKVIPLNIEILQEYLVWGYDMIYDTVI